MRTSLLKSQLINYDEADKNFEKLKHALRHGHPELVERIATDIQIQNRSSRDAIHAELEQGSDLVVLVG